MVQWEGYVWCMRAVWCSREAVYCVYCRGMFGALGRQYMVYG